MTGRRPLSARDRVIAVQPAHSGQVAVFGVPDDSHGEEVMAWLRFQAGDTATAAGIREACRGHIAHFEIPRDVRFVDAFPMAVTGKRQKFRRREMAVAQTAASGSSPAA